MHLRFPKFARLSVKDVWVRAKNNTGAAHALTPGIILATMIALASSYLSEHYGGPAMLFALLIGMAFNHLAEDAKMRMGIAFSSRELLRIGVALLGVRITFEQIGDLGLATGLLVVSGVAFALVAGYFVARALDIKRDCAILYAGAVAICGASAALAIASVLPNRAHIESNTLVTVAGVTALSTLAMIIYPMITAALSLADLDAGVFIGATIHDVAQVIGAGYIVSDTAGETAAVVKLLRVACLLPAVAVIGVLFREQSGSKGGMPAPPLFLIAFALLVAATSFGFVPAFLQTGLTELSRWCLLTAVASLGVKTSLPALATLGPRPLIALTAQTILLALFILGGLVLL